MMPATLDYAMAKNFKTKANLHTTVRRLEAKWATTDLAKFVEVSFSFLKTGNHRSFSVKCGRNKKLRGNNTPAKVYCNYYGWSNRKNVVYDTSKFECNEPTGKNPYGGNKPSKKPYGEKPSKKPYGDKPKPYEQKPYEPEPPTQKPYQPPTNDNYQQSKPYKPTNKPYQAPSKPTYKPDTPKPYQPSTPKPYKPDTPKPYQQKPTYKPNTPKPYKPSTPKPYQPNTPKY